MHIGLIAPPWIPIPPAGYGGTESVVFSLAKGLAAIGHEVTLFAHPGSDCPAVTVVSGPPLPPGTAIGTSQFELEHALAAYEEFQSHRIDVLHDHTLAGPLVASLFATAPVVATNHGPFNREFGRIFEAAARQCAIIAISHAHAASAPATIKPHVI